jgi:non-homologous end joining protein Ku
MRPYWKGYLKLALVSCPISLHAACSTAEHIAFRQTRACGSIAQDQTSAGKGSSATPAPRKRA